MPCSMRDLFGTYKDTYQDTYKGTYKDIFKGTFKGIYKDTNLQYVRIRYIRSQRFSRIK